MAQLKDLLVEGKSRFIDKIYASDQFISKVVQGTSPFLIDSSTLVSNLNADLLDGYHAERLLHGAYNKSVVYDILEISRTDTPQEIIIKTKLPFTNGNEIPSIYIRGYAYGNSVPMNVHLVFYIYGGAFCNYSAVSYGAWNPRIFLFTYVEGSTTYVGIGLKKSVYYPRFWIDIADIWTSAGSRYHAGWTYEVNTNTSTTIIPTDNQKEVGYTSLATSITGSAGSVDWANITNKPATATGYGYIGKTAVQASSAQQNLIGIGDSSFNGVMNIKGKADSYTQGIRIYDAAASGTHAISSIWFRATADSGYSAGMIGLTADSTGLRFRLSASATGTSPNDYVNILYGGNVGIGTTTPTYKLQVDGSTSTKQLTATARVIFSGLDSGSSDVTDGTEILTSYASNNGFADSNGTGIVYRRQASKLYNYIKSKTDLIYAKYSDILDVSTNPSANLDLNTRMYSTKFTSTSWDYAHATYILNQQAGSSVSSAGTVFSFPGSYPFQIQRDYNSNNYYLRGYYSNTGWQPWVRIALSGESYTKAESDALYLPLAGGWMNWNAQIYFKGLNNSTSVYSKIGYATSASGQTMHCVNTAGHQANGAFYITTNGSTSANDTGGLAIDNEGVTVFGAGDAGSNFTGIFRVLNEDNVADGPQFIVTKASGATTKYSHTAQRFISKVAQGTAPIQVDSSTVSPNLNADYLDGEHAYELRSKPKNNSYIIFSSLPFLESGIGMFSSTPAVSMENAPEGLCYGPITSYKQYTSDFIAVEPGETVYGEIWAYRASGATGTAGTLYYGIQRYDRNKKPISANAGLNAPNNGYFVCSGTTVPADGTWHKYSNTHTIPTSHTVYSGSDGKGVYYIKVYVLVNYSAGTIPTYIGRFLLSRTVKIAETANSVSKMQTVSSTSANNHYLTFVDSNNSPAAEETVYTTSKTVIQPSTGNLITEGYVAMGTGRANSYIGSDAANNIWLHNSSGYAVVCDANVVRRGASLTTGQLGNSTYPWASVYGTNIYTRYVSIDSSAAGNAAHIQFNRASYNYIQIPTNGTLSVNINGAGSANSYFKIDSTGVYPGDKDASYNLGSASLRWKDFYTAKANVRQTASAALGIATSTPYKIGTAKKDINIETIANGSGTGINDGYAAGLTFGDTSAAYAGIYYQTSGSYGSRLIFATTSSYANGSYGRVIISNSGYVGIGTMSPSQLLHVAGTIYSSVAQGTAPLKVDSSTLVANLHSEFTDYASVLRDPTYHTLGSRRNSANITFADGGLHYYLATSSMSAANGKPDSDGHILHMAWDNSKWDAQLTLPTSATGVMQWRVQTNGTDASWSPWKTVIDSSNIGSQSVAYATVASKISDITTSDAASSTATWRRVWFSYNDNVTGRPAYSDNFTYQTSTGTLKVGKLSITGAAGNSWLGGQQDGPINLNNATNTGSYWPWIRQTNTGSSKYFSIGVLNTSFYIIGSASSRTDNGYDYGWSFNVANGWAYGNFQNADTVDGLHASDFARKIVAGTAIAMANASGTITVETNKIIPVTTTGTTAVTFNFTWNSPAACDEAHVIITGSGSSKTITIGNVNSDSTNTKKNNTAIKVTSGGYGEISILYFDSKYFIRAVGN